MTDKLVVDFAAYVDDEKLSHFMSSTSVRHIEEVLDQSCTIVHKDLRKVLLYDT